MKILEIFKNKLRYKNYSINTIKVYKQTNLKKKPMKTKTIILATILLVSCGTRKVENTKTDVKTKDVTIDKSVTETKSLIETKVIDFTEKDELEIEPIDNTKEIIVNGKLYKNVRLKIKKQKNNIVIDKTEKVAKKQQNNVKTKFKAKIEVKQKNTESSKGNFWNWILLFLAVAGVIYFIIWSKRIVNEKDKLNL